MAKKAKSDRAREGGSTSDDRRTRQAAALRENLRKRKQQSRARAAVEPNKPGNNRAPEP